MIRALKNNMSLLFIGYLPGAVLDTLIAAHALARGLILVSNNLKEFARVDGLRCENWVDVA